jgi:hypothetical protein
MYASGASGIRSSAHEVHSKPDIAINNQITVEGVKQLMDRIRPLLSSFDVDIFTPSTFRDVAIVEQSINQRTHPAPYTTALRVSVLL